MKKKRQAKNCDCNNNKKNSTENNNKVNRRHPPKSQHFPRWEWGDVRSAKLHREESEINQRENCCALRVCRCSPVLPVTLSCSISLPTLSLSASLFFTAITTTTTAIATCYHHHYNYPVERSGGERKRAVERAAASARASLVRAMCLLYNPRTSLLARSLLIELSF